MKSRCCECTLVREVNESHRCEECENRMSDLPRGDVRRYGAIADYQSVTMYFQDYIVVCGDGS